MTGELGPNELQELKGLIKEEIDRMIFKEKYSEDFNLQEEDRKEDVDQANSAVSTSQRLRFRNRESFYYRKLKSALERIEMDDYGYCVECEDPIGYQRLKARPTAELCIICKEESERDESMTLTGKKSQSYGHTISAS